MRVAVVASCAAALWTATARADDRAIVVAETPVRSAPFEVAPEIARLHVGDRVHGDDQPQGDWRRIVLPDGRFGFVRDADTQHTDPAPTPTPPPSPVSTAGGGATDTSSPSGPSPQPPPPAVLRKESPRASAGPHLVGVTFELMPAGTVSTATSGGGTSSADSVFAVAVAPFVDGALTRYLAVGFSPQIIFRVKPDGSSAVESAKEIDLRVRLKGRAPLSPRVRAFGLLSPGYSIVLLPSTPAANTSAARPDPAGLVIDFSVGIEVAVLPNLFVVSGLGYQAGFQSTDDGNLHVSYLHLGAGFAIGL